LLVHASELVQCLHVSHTSEVRVMSSCLSLWGGSPQSWAHLKASSHPTIGDVDEEFVGLVIATLPAKGLLSNLSNMVDLKQDIIKKGERTP